MNANETQSKTKAPKKAGKDGASTDEKPVRRRKPDASDEPTRPAVSFVEALLAPVAPAGRLVEPSGAPAPRQMTMADLPARERRALAFHASDFHRDASQIEAFEAGTSGPTEPARAIQGTRRLVELGLLQERHAYFVTPLGKAVAASGGITVTRPVALDAAPAEVTS